MTLRTGRLSDVDALEGLERGAFTHDRLSRRSFARFLNRPSALLLVAEGGNAVSGYAVVLFRSRSRSARLYSLAVDPEQAGYGIGATMLRAAERAARLRGCTSMRLEVREDNGPAKFLYRKFGYSLIKRLTAYYGDGGEALRLQKHLQPAA